MITPEYRIAKVMDNNDPDQEGKVKIFVYDEMEGWSNDHLPWARANSSSTGSSSTEGESNIPENNSIIIVYPEKVLSKKNWYYKSGFDLKNHHPHSLFNTNVKSAISSQGSYPNVKYKYYKNGICTGVDSSSANPEAFLYHPEGTFIFIDKDGAVNIEAAKKLSVKQGKSEFIMDDGVTEIKGELKVEKEITWNNGTVPTKASTHIHTGNLGLSTSPPTAGS